AGSANIGDRISMFEAIHGSAPDIAGMGIANPSAMLNAACMMLVHIGKHDKAELIQNAWLCALEDGFHPADVYREGISRVKAGTAAFADAVIERLGRQPAQLKPVHAKGGEMPPYVYERPVVKRQLCGVDLFVCDAQHTPNELAEKLLKASHGMLKLKLITNRGVKVWPDGFPETFCTDHWRCRFVGPEVEVDMDKATYQSVGTKQVIQLMQLLEKAHIEVEKTENLYLIDGVRGFSL
ncbi:MAG: isocitrate/isopropylmalate family dehydrogenase, partial [Flavobacteriales bacterium]